MKRGTNKSTNSGSEIERDILEVLKKSENPVSTSEIELKIGKAWHTVDRHCLKLQLAGEIHGFRIGKMNVWKIEREDKK